MISARQPARPQARAHDVRGLDGPDRGGRSASGAAAPEGHRTQSRPHARGTGAARRRSRTTSSRPTSAIRRANANGPIYGVDWGNDGFLTLDPKSTRRRRSASRCSTRECRRASRSRCRSLRRTGATSRTGSTRRSRITPRWTAKDASGCRRAFAGPRISRRSATNHPPRAGAAPRRASGRSQYFDPKHAAVQSSRHLLRHAPRAVRERRRRDALRQRRVQRRASAGSTHACSKRPATRGKAQGWCMPVLRRQRRRQDRCLASTVRVRGSLVERHARGAAGAGDLLQRDRASDGRQRLGRGAGPDAGTDRAASTRRLRLARSTSRRSTSGRQRHRLHAARHRRRLATASSGRRSPAAGISRASTGASAASCRARRRRRPALPRRVDAVSARRARSFKGVDDDDRRRLPLLQLRRPLQHARPRRERAAGERHELGLAARPAARRQLGRAARAVSARVLLARDGRPHRRSERRLEGPRLVCATTARTPCGTSKAARARAARVVKFQMRPDPLAK